jgi:hypothetical protein
MSLGAALKSNITGKSENGPRGTRPDVLGTDVIGLPGEMGGFGGGAYGLMRVPAKYYLELRFNNKFNYMISFPYDPSSVVIERTVPTIVTQTLGGTIREYAPQRRHAIQISGRSGRAERIAYNRNGGIIFQDGETVFTEFDEFLKLYNENNAIAYHNGIDGINNSPAAMNTSVFLNTISSLSSAPKGSYMVLRCIDEDAHFKVEPITFQYNRNTSSNRFDFNYTLTLEAYDYAYDSKQYNPIMGVLDAVDNIAGLAGGVIGFATNIVSNINNDYIRGLGKALQSLGTIVDALDGLANSLGATKSSLDYLSSSFCDTLDKFSGISNSWSQMATRWSGDDVNASQRPLEEDQEAQEVIELAEDQKELRVIEQHSYSVETPETDDEELQLVYSRVQSSENELKNIGKIARGGISKSFYEGYQFSKEEAYYPGKFLKNEKNLEILSTLHPDKLSANKANAGNINLGGIKVFLQRDEDLKKVALKYLGSARDVDILITSNGWLDERRKGDGTFAQGGDFVIIPDSLASSIQPFSEDGVIGGQISIPWDDMSFNIINGDFEITERSQTLEQTLRTILLTGENELKLNPEFGIPSIVKNNFDVQFQGTLLRESIVAHPYFTEVTDIEIVLENDTLTIEGQVTAINGEVIPIRAPGMNL